MRNPFDSLCEAIEESLNDSMLSPEEIQGFIMLHSGDHRFLFCGSATGQPLTGPQMWMFARLIRDLLVGSFGGQARDVLELAIAQLADEEDIVCSTAH